MLWLPGTMCTQYFEQEPQSHGPSCGLVTLVRSGLVPEYFGRQHIGRISGAMGGMSLLARAAAPLGAAWLLLALPGYRELVGVMALFALAAALAFMLARPPQRVD